MKKLIRKIGDRVLLPADPQAGLPAQRARVISIDLAQGVAVVGIIPADRLDKDRDGLVEVEIDQEGRVKLSDETAGPSRSS